MDNKTVIITGGAGRHGDDHDPGNCLKTVPGWPWFDNQEERLQAMARSTAGVADEGALITPCADITMADECERVTQAVLDRFGRVDALVQCRRHRHATVAAPTT